MFVVREFRSQVEGGLHLVQALAPVAPVETVPLDKLESADQPLLGQ